MKTLKLTGLFFIALMSVLISTVTGWNPLAVGAGLALASFVPMPQGTANMAVTKELWTRDIVDNLFKDNGWAHRAYNADGNVLNGKVVHIPVAGSPSTVKKNLTTFPQTAVKRTDTDITYAIDTLYTIPRHIEAIEKYELAYDKRESVLGEDRAKITQDAMDNLLYRWAPTVAANYIATAGAARPASVSGATGNRLAFTKAAFNEARKKMNKDNILKTGRVAILTSDHYAEFLESLSEGEKTNFGRVTNMETGLVGKYLDFDVYERSSVLRYRGASVAAAAVVDELDEAFVPAATDIAASLFYQEKAVERALGDVQMFDQTNDPTYYGDVYSFILRFGGRQRRAKGVYAALETPA